MANFLPLKRYMLIILDSLIKRHRLKPPFLDAGCGEGDVMVHLAQKGWNGRGIDLSPEAVARTSNKLILQRDFNKFKNGMQPSVSTAIEDIFKEKGVYSTIILWDVLEHEKEDTKMVSKINELLEFGGYLVLSVPVHRKEWRWDDEFYGHRRRYEIEELKDLLENTGFSIQECWDFMFPVFWAIRRVYTRFFSKPQIPELIEVCTIESSRKDAWDVISWVTSIASWNIWWYPLYLVQWLFKKWRKGHGVIILAQKVSMSNSIELDDVKISEAVPY